MKGAPEVIMEKCDKVQLADEEPRNIDESFKSDCQVIPLLFEFCSSEVPIST